MNNQGVAAQYGGATQQLGRLVAPTIRRVLGGQPTPLQQLRELERKIKYETNKKGKMTAEERLSELRGRINELQTFTETPGDLNLFIEADKTLSPVEQEYIKQSLALKTPATPPSQMGPSSRGTTLRREMGIAEQSLPRFGEMSSEQLGTLGGVFSRGLETQGWPQKWGGKTPPLTRPESPEALKSLQNMLFGGVPKTASQAGLSMAKRQGPGEWRPTEASKKAMMGVGFEEIGSEKERGLMALLTMDRDARTAVYTKTRLSTEELIDEYPMLRTGSAIPEALGLGSKHMDNFNPEEQQKETFEERLVDYVNIVKRLPGLSRESLIYLGRNWLRELWGAEDPWQTWMQKYWGEIAKESEYKPR